MSVHLSNPTSSATGLPSFARSTKASRLRQTHSSASDAHPLRTTNTVPSTTIPDTAANKPKPVVVDGKSYLYRNGGLTVRNFGYLVSTKSTINRFGENEQRREEYCGVCHPNFAKPDPEILPYYASPNADDEECSQPADPAPIISQVEFEDRIIRKGIALRTRLHLEIWRSKPANNVIMDHDEVYDILSRAEKLAKRCLWKWLRANRPRKCAWRGLHYLSDMDLGRDRLELLSFGQENFYDHRWTKSHEVKRVLEDLIDLRNRVHHFNGGGYTMASVDEHLYDVHHLAVLLYDEETAEYTRALRARFRQAAEGVAREIEAVRYLTVLPFAGDHPWQPHHIELFREVLWKRRNYPNTWDYDRIWRQYSPAVIAASQEYDERGNYMSWDCEPDVEQSLANVQKLAEGGYGKAIPAPSPDSQRGRINWQLPPSRWRSASVNGPRRLSSREEKYHEGGSARRGSFCLGGVAMDRSHL